MSTLLLRLAAPLQSWGADAKFERRGTERVPTRSGVIGLVAAALGRRRDETTEDLEPLRFGVRVDREGALLRDYHTAKSERSAYVTNRYYLSDAVFLAGLEGDEALLNRIEEAFRRPMFPVFLGRRSCPPEGEICLGVRAGKALEEALREEAWLVGRTGRHRASEVRLRIVLDAEDGGRSSYLLRDAPLSFDQTHRQFGFRRIYEAAPAVLAAGGGDSAAPKQTGHDAMSELEG